MGKPSIENKVADLIGKGDCGEPEAMYLLVESCKYIERNNIDPNEKRIDNKKLIKIFRDWAVHTNKDKCIECDSVGDINFKALKKEIEDLFNVDDIDDVFWSKFKKSYIEIVNEQYICLKINNKKKKYKMSSDYRIV